MQLLIEMVMPVPRLKVLLLKSEIVDFESALKADENGRLPDPVPLKPEIGLDGVMHLRRPEQKDPAWLEFIQQGLEQELGFKTATAGALLLVRTSGRMFAIPFGYGRLLLRPSAHVRDFGVKIALNVIDVDNGIRSLDLMKTEDMTVNTRVQTSRAARLSVFGVDKSKDFLRAIAGKPLDGFSFGRTVVGTDSASITMDVQFNELGAVCDELLEIYGRDDYAEKGFEFYDNLHPVVDSEQIAELDAKLDEALASGDTTPIHLALPDAMDLDDIDGYKYRGYGPQRSELDIDEMIEDLSAADMEVTSAWLKSHYLYLSFSTAPEHDYRKCELYDCVVFETRLDDDGVYILAGGDWHRASDDFIAAVDGKLADIPLCDLVFPDCADGVEEGVYNAGVAHRLDCALMDRKDVSFGGYDKMELCDLLSRDGRFVHVKKREKSSTLSHLFMQGLNSARLLLESPVFRTIARDAIEAVNPTFVDCVPEATPDVSKVEIVFGIISPEKHPVPGGLPFFSRLSLAESFDVLDGMGYRVSLAHIKRV